MDYSLLPGIHYRVPQHLQSLLSFDRCVTIDGLGSVPENVTMEDEISPRGLVLVPHGGSVSGNSLVVGPHVRGSRLRTTSSAGGGQEVDHLLPGTARLQIQLGVNLPARAEHVPGNDDQEMLHDVYEVVLYVGIIDILQKYDIFKKIEHAYKSIQFDSGSISVVNPKVYSKRFLDFIKKVFPSSAAVG